MARARLAVPFALALFIVGCSDGGEDASDGSPDTEISDLPGQLEPFADILGCDSWTDALSDGRLGSAVGHACVVDQSQVAWVHLFPANERGLHFRHLERRSPSDYLERTACADGQPPPGTGPWILVGDDWAVSSYHEDRVARVSEGLGGEYAGGGGDGEAAPPGPPVSFQVPDPCADG